MTKSPPYAALLIVLAVLGGCAEIGVKPTAALPTPEPANLQTQLYADCVHQASGAGGKLEKFGHLIRFTCEGSPAQALYDSAEIFSGQRKWADCAGWLGRCVRYFTPRPWDDQCEYWVGPKTYTCRIHLNVGPFLDASTGRLRQRSPD
jgi:hypothetical protein